MIDGLLFALQPDVLVYALLGVVLGVVLGMIPGVSATVGVALLVPVTFLMDPATGIIMLSGIYTGAIFGGSISAILLRVPGTPASVVVMWDGYPLQQMGRGSYALGAATIASAFGGLVGGIVLFAFSPVIANIALLFGPPEFVALVVLSLVVVTMMVDEPLLPAVAGVFVGLALSTVGLDPVHGLPRYTFDQYELASGLDIIAVMIGMFALTEAVRLAGGRVHRPAAGADRTVEQKRARPSLRELRANWWNLLRSSMVGVGFGILPGVGPESSPFVSYSLAKRASRNPEQFGKGSVEGVMAAESSNNANVGGSLVPLVTLGIPGSATAAVFVGALALHGLRPGPLLFERNPEIVYALFTGFLFTGIFILAVGLGLARYITVVLRLPPAILATGITFFSVVGAYAVENNIFNVWVMLGAALLAALLLWARLGLVPVILGLILGPVLETNAVRALSLSQGSPTIFLTRPMSLLFVLLTVAMVLLGMRIRRQRRQAAQLR